MTETQLAERFGELVRQFGALAEQYRAALRPNRRGGGDSASRDGGNLTMAEALAKIVELRQTVDVVMAADDDDADATSGEPDAAAP